MAQGQITVPSGYTLEQPQSQVKPPAGYSVETPAPSPAASSSSRLNPPKESLIPSNARISAPPIGGQYGGGNWNPENWGDEARQKLMKYEPFRNAMKLLLGGQNVGQPLGTSSGILNNPVTQSILPGGPEERGAEEGVDAAEATEPVAAKAIRNVGHGISDAVSGKIIPEDSALTPAEQVNPKFFEKRVPEAHPVYSEENPGLYSGKKPGMLTRGRQLIPYEVSREGIEPINLETGAPSHFKSTPIRTKYVSESTPSRLGKFIHTPIIPNAPYTSPKALALEAILGGGLGYAGMRVARSILGGSK